MEPRNAYAFLGLQACYHKPKSLSLVTDVKKINISLRMVKN